MKTARERKEANTVQLRNNMVQPRNAVRIIEDLASLKPGTWQSHVQRAAVRIERDYPWSSPSRAAMSFRLAALYAVGNGQVPV